MTNQNPRLNNRLSTIRTKWKTVLVVAVAIIASFSIGVYANQVKVQNVGSIGGNHVLVPAPELAILNNFWRINVNQSLVTTVTLLVTTNGSGPVVNKIYQVVVQVSCKDDVTGIVRTCSTGTGVIPLPSNINGSTAILPVSLNPPIDPETTEIDDLSYIVTGVTVPSTTPGVIAVSTGSAVTLDSNGMGTLQATLVGINGFNGAVTLTGGTGTGGGIATGGTIGTDGIILLPAVQDVMISGNGAGITLQIDASGAGPGNYLVMTSLSCANCPSGNVLLSAPSWWVTRPGFCFPNLSVKVSPASLFMMLTTPTQVQNVTVIVTSNCGFTGNAILTAAIPALAFPGNQPPIAYFPPTPPQGPSIPLSFPFAGDVNNVTLTVNATNASFYAAIYTLTLNTNAPLSFAATVPVQVSPPPA